MISTALDIAGFAISLVAVFAAFMAYSEIKERLKVHRTRHWVKTHATIQNVRQRPAQEVSRIQTDAWAVEFEYHYEANGMKYSKKDRMILRWEKSAANVARGLAVKGMSVRFDPDDLVSSVFYFDEVYDEFCKT